MPFIPALVDVAVGIGEAVAGAAGAASTVAEVGGEAAVGAEAATEAGEVGGNVASIARNALDIGKQVYDGAKQISNGVHRADDIAKVLNGNGNGNTGTDRGNPALSAAIDGMSGVPTFDRSGAFQNNEDGGSPTLAATGETSSATIPRVSSPADDMGSMADIGPMHSSGNLRI